ncbi:MAG TPA: type II toxin-antitoxin system HicA family toxin [Candidatus Angelobacter sp.]|nr:type II toxin-antitoxin system HicA family toxin [Candidatus Angelobacter sp.]
MPNQENYYSGLVLFVKQNINRLDGAENRALAGFSYREAVRRLRTFGFQFDRQGPGSHKIWRHSQTRRKVTIPHHTGDLAEGRQVLVEVVFRFNAAPGFQ